MFFFKFSSYRYIKAAADRTSARAPVKPKTATKEKANQWQRMMDSSEPVNDAAAAAAAAADVVEPSWLCQSSNGGSGSGGSGLTAAYEVGLCTLNQVDS